MITNYCAPHRTSHMDSLLKKLAYATPSKGKRFGGIVMLSWSCSLSLNCTSLGTRLVTAHAPNCKPMQALVESRISTVPMAMSPWQCLHGPWCSQTLFSCVWCVESGNKSHPRLLPRSFLMLTSGRGGRG